MIRSFAVIAVVISMLGLCASAHGLAYQRTDLDLPGSTESYAYGLGENGQVVGTAKLSDGFWHAFVWADGVTEFLTTPNHPNSAAFDVDSSGQVVGYSYLLSTFSDSTHPVLWQNGVALDLGDSHGTTGGALRISGSGQIIGYSYSQEDQLLTTLWQDGNIAHLGTLGQASVGNDINAGGAAVGFSYFINGTRRATLWSDGAIADLGTLGGANSQAQGINSGGWICGYAETASGHTHAFLRRDSAMHDLGALSGSSSYGMDINAAGVVVGYLDFEDGSSHAAVWRNGHGTDLGAGGAVSSQARAVNDKGWICGFTKTSNDVGQAVLWKPLPICAITNRSACYDAVVPAVSGRYQFKIWGKVTIIDGDSFMLDDGSGSPVRVIAPGYSGITGAGYASAVGTLSGFGSDSVLNSSPSDVIKLP